MPCRDDGYRDPCGLAHLKDATVAELKAELARKLANKKKAEKERKKREAAAAYRSKMINIYLARAVASFGVSKIKGNVIVIFAEDDKTETYTWKAEKVMEELRKWLEGCRRFPQDMSFQVRYEKDRPVLWSWHTHKESA